MQPNTIDLPAAAAPAAGFNLDDIYYALFRHKWKIVLCSLLGIGAAIAFYFLKPPPFESSAKIFIRYVTEEKAPALADGDKTISAEGGGSIIATEEAILGSLDVADQVADAVGPDKILG